MSKCLGAVEDLVKLGRKHGIGPVLFTQRGSGLNKEVSELCDMLVAFRTPGPLDQDRVKDWLDANTTKAQRDEVMGRLSGLATGTAIFASGHPDLKLFGVHAVRWPDTFDSSATPKVGQRRAEPKRLATPDLEDLKVKMATTIERAKADDPRELRKRVSDRDKRIAELERMVAQAQSSPATTAPSAHDIAQAKREVRSKWEPLLKERDGRIRDLERKLDRIERSLEKAHDLHDEIAKELGRELPKLSAVPAIEALPVAPPPHRDVPVSHRVATAPRPDGGNGKQPELSGPEQRIVDAIAWMESIGIREPEQTAVAFLAGYTIGGGAFNNPRGALRTKGLIDYRGSRLVLTDTGRFVAHYPDGALTPDELQRRVLERLPGPEQKILRVLLEMYPKSIDNDSLARRAGYEPGGGAFNNPRGRLRSLGLIDYPERGQVVAQPVLFLEGAR